MSALRADRQPVIGAYWAESCMAGTALIVIQHMGGGEPAWAVPNPARSVLKPGVRPAPNEQQYHQRQRRPESPVLDRARAPIGLRCNRRKLHSFRTVARLFVLGFG